MQPFAISSSQSVELFKAATLHWESDLASFLMIRLQYTIDPNAKILFLPAWTTILSKEVYMLFLSTKSLVVAALITGVLSASWAGESNPARIRLINEVCSDDLKSAFASEQDPISHLWSSFVSIKCTVPFVHPGKYNKKFSPGHYDVHIIGGNNTVFHTSTLLDLNPGHDYTFFATGIGNNVESFCVDQTTILKKSGQQTLQFVNASPDAGPVDFYTNSTLAAGNVAYKAVTAPFDVFTIPTFMEIKQAGTSNIIDQGVIKIAKESRTFFVLTGTANPNDTFPLWGFYYNDKSKAPGEFLNTGF